MPILKSKHRDIFIPKDLSITDYVLQKTEQYGDKAAFIDGQTGRVITFRELPRLVRAVGSGLCRRGFRQGDVLCVLAVNCVEYGIIFHAVTSIGGIVTTCNPVYTPEEIRNQLKDSGATYIITQSPFINNVKQAVARSPKVKDVFCMGDHGGSILEFESLMRDDGSKYFKAKIRPTEDVAVLPYSSGTTGMPKGVMLTHQNLVSNVIQTSAPAVGMADYSDVYVSFLPFFHIYGIMVVQNFALVAGCTNVILPRFDLEEYLRTVEKYKATFLHIVPPVAVLLAKHPVVSKYDLSSVHTVFSGAAPLGADTSKQIGERLKVSKIIQGFGMTETSPGVTISPPVGWKNGSCGLLIPNTQLKIVDIETGAVLGPNQEGEVCVLGPQNMKGYLNNERATKNTVDPDGWLHTGDIGYYDNDEQLYIVDRLKELIKYNAFQVPPAELESLLLSHESVADAAVIGVPDESAGELPRAYVVLKQGRRVSEQEIAKFVEARVAHYKRLRGGVEFVKEIPKSASGKILRRMIKAEAVKRLKSKL